MQSPYLCGCLIKLWRCGVGRCKRDGTLVAGHPIITAHFPFLVFSQLFNPSHFTIMDRVQAFGKNFRYVDASSPNAIP